MQHVLRVLSIFGLFLSIFFRSLFITLKYVFCIEIWSFYIRNGIDYSTFAFILLSKKTKSSKRQKWVGNWVWNWTWTMPWNVADIHTSPNVHNSKRLQHIYIILTKWFDIWRRRPFSPVLHAGDCNRRPTALPILAKFTI